MADKTILVNTSILIDYYRKTDKSNALNDWQKTGQHEKSKILL